MRSANICLATAILSCGLLSEARAQEERGPYYSIALPMSVSIDDRVTPQMAHLLDRLMIEKRDMRLDGVEVFAANDKFLPGKIAVAFSYAIEGSEPGSADRARYLQGFGEVARMTLADANETWGIYYYLSALQRLDRLGVLDQAVDPETLTQLRQRLDWRTFVDEGRLELINLPNNYFGVAYSVARLRNQLGWEDEQASGQLLAKTLDHYRVYSGEFGFADETDGQGRFDRYSVLLIGEIAQRFIEAGIEPPSDVRRWLRGSVDLILPRLNARGEGFEYGRSIGAYGETAFLEVLTAAAVLNLLTLQEEEVAYAYSSRVAARYGDYWTDSGTASVNLWDHGRKTDTYRGKHRILGENLSLSHQLIYTQALWNRRGWAGRSTAIDIEDWVSALPRSTLTRFSRGDYDRALLTYRDGDRVISLPIINGGATQHMNTPYYPIPFSPGVLAGSPDESFPQLIPAVFLDDGSELRPLAFFSQIESQQQGDRTVITWTQSTADRMGAEAPQPDARVRFETRYEFSPGQITRFDRIIPVDGVDISRIEMVFASFSSLPRIENAQTEFQSGEISSWKVDGMDCETTAVDPNVHATPTGAFRSVISCSARPSGGLVNIGWTLNFRPEASLPSL